LKKIISILLSLILVVFSAPMAVHAAQSDGVIDKHGAKTYVGTATAWGKAWDEDSFEEVTDKDVNYSGNLTVKNGDVKNIIVSGSDSRLIVLNGAINSVQTDGDVTLTGGVIKRNVESDKKITFNGSVKIWGTCAAQDIASSGNTTAVVSGIVTGYNSIALTGQAIRASGFDGNDSGTLNVKNYTLPLPPITDMESVTIDGSNTANGKIIANTLSINTKSELTASSTIEVDTLSGPGTLSYYSGKLTVHWSIQNKPLLYFINSVSNGTVAFRSDSSSVSEEDVRLYDFELAKNSSGGYYQFTLKNSIREGITLEPSSVTVDSKSPALIRANVRPSFSQFAAGTKIVWELHGDSTAFSISPDAGKNTCKVTLNSTKTGSYKATLIAYLVDKYGDRLSDYKSDSCVVTAGGTPSIPPDNRGLTLDTSSVIIPVGGTYWVLAVTNSAVPPQQMSYNSAVATVGAAKAYTANGKTGWLYPVTGVSKGGVTIDIGGQKMITKIAGGSIVVDTASYTMNPGGKYCIGVRLNNIQMKDLNVHSANSCTTVQYAGRAANGLDLFVVTARQTGVGSVLFDIIGGQSVRTAIIIQDGVTPGGVSGRIIAAA
jgi:hypothetical protein